MAKKNKGYIPLWRDLQDHWLWQSPTPFDERSAWVDLLMSVNHEEKKIKIDGRVQIIKPGQMWTSYKKLANRWNWSRERVYRYTKMLKSDGMIYVDATPRGTLLTVINYRFFALQGNTDKTTDKTSAEATIKTSDEATLEAQTIMNNNDKECKRMKNKEEPAALPIEPPTGGGEWQ